MLFAATPTQSAVVAVSILATIVALSYAVLAIRRAAPVRPIFDVVRLAVQVAGVIIMGRIVGVETSPGLLAGATLIGCGLGAMQGSSVEAHVENGRVWIRRSALGILIWGVGVVAMQVTAFLNMVGALRIGQALAWGAIGITVGLLIGRLGPVREVLSAASVVVVMLLGAIVATQASPPELNAQDGEVAADFIATCTANGPHQTPSFGSDCEAAAPTFVQGQAGAFDSCWDTEFAGNTCQRYFDTIIMYGQVDLAMLTCETPFSQVPSCAGSAPDPPATTEAPATTAPETTVARETTTVAPTTTAAPATTQAPVRTTIVTESIDPDAAPPVSSIADEGELLTRPTTPAGTTGSDSNSGDGGSSGSSQASATDSAQSQPAVTEPPETAESSSEPEFVPITPTAPESSLAAGELEAETEPPAEIPAERSLEQAIAAFVAAGVIGITTWSEAMSAVDAITRSAPGTAQARYGHLEVPDPVPATATAPAATPAAPGNGVPFWQTASDPPRPPPPASPGPTTTGGDPSATSSPSPSSNDADDPPFWQQTGDEAGVPQPDPVPPEPTEPPSTQTTTSEPAGPEAASSNDPEGSPEANTANTSSPEVEELINRLQQSDRAAEIMSAEDIDRIATFARDPSQSTLQIRPQIEGLTASKDVLFDTITVTAGQPTPDPAGGISIPYSSTWGDSVVRVQAQGGRIVVMSQSGRPGMVEGTVIDELAGRLDKLNRIAASSGREVTDVSISLDGTLSIETASPTR